MASNTMKWILGIAFGLVACLVIAVVLWWNTSGSTLVHGVIDPMRDGRRFGQGIAATVCVDTAIARQSAVLATGKARGDSATPAKVLAMMAPSVFFQGCLTSAQGSDDLCQGVPLQTNDRKQLENWAVAECRTRHAEGAGCPAIMAGLQVYCGRRGRART